MYLRRNNNKSYYKYIHLFVISSIYGNATSKERIKRQILAQNCGHCDLNLRKAIVTNELLEFYIPGTDNRHKKSDRANRVNCLGHWSANSLVKRAKDLQRLRFLLRAKFHLKNHVSRSRFKLD